MKGHDAPGDQTSMDHAPSTDPARMSRIALVHSFAEQIRNNLRAIHVPGDNMVFVIDTPPGAPAPIVWAQRLADVLACLDQGAPELAAELRAADPRGDHWIVCFAEGGCSGGPALSFGVDVRLDAPAAAPN